MLFCFFNDTATTEIYTLSLHDALPILGTMPGPLSQDLRDRLTAAVAAGSSARAAAERFGVSESTAIRWAQRWRAEGEADRKSTRLNSSHANISYAVFCLKKKDYTR